MARKSSLLKQTLIFSACTILIIYAFFNTFLSSSTTAATTGISSTTSSLFAEQISRENFQEFPEKVTENEKKVGVFMYDLPKKFTTGIIENHALARGSSDLSKVSYPGHQHMGEWYMYLDLSRPDLDRVGSPVVKVNDPEEADLFYVPVFYFSQFDSESSSGRDSTRSDPAYSDEKMQEELVSDFGRVRSDQGSLIKDVIVPYSHRINVYNGDIGVEERKPLLVFIGQSKEEDVVIRHGTQSRENRRTATRGMHTSKFCLNPAGDTPSACRLFDSIVSLCVPLIVSDSIELPFEDVIDYRKIAIFVDTESSLKPGYLVGMLRAVSTEKILEYQKEMRELSWVMSILEGNDDLLLEVKRYFVYSDSNGTVNEIWREVAQKLPLYSN
ncbi:hypothetical protein POTOM_060474 [Populus tomentosa]|uniref:Exostosin GT47 domain-containing protein n=1 Tax=Populus tomentosa TaxID=118781 RepID=A0A8X7XQT3_POPTO|nr:hypothetical protein POTOM_060474 [Populus tomentosa]